MPCSTHEGSAAESSSIGRTSSSTTTSSHGSNINVTSSQGAGIGGNASGGRGDSSRGGDEAGEARAGEDGEDCSNKLVYMTAVGTMNNCLGGASLYVSIDELRRRVSKGGVRLHTLATSALLFALGVVVLASHVQLGCIVLFGFKR
eukprot:1157739-Pelagomonas_calceolata.AAC.4